MDANKNNPASNGSPFQGVGANIFGTAASKASDTPTGSFGISTTFSASSAAASTTPQSSPAKTPSFGAAFGNPTTSSTPISFGINTGGTATSASKLSFGGFTNSSSTPAPSSSKSSIFGNTSNNPTTGTANNSTASTLFNPKPAGAAAPSGSSSTNVSTSNTPSTATSGSQPGIFGAAITSKTGSTSLFSSTPVGSTGSTVNASTTFSFGVPPASQPTKDANSSKSMFGGGDGSKAAAPSTSLFGSKPADPPSSDKGPTPAGNATPAFPVPPSTSSSPSPSLFTSTTAKTGASNELPAKPASITFGATTGGGLSVKSTAPAKSSPLATNSSIPGEGSQTTSSSIPKPTGTPPATPSTKPNINLAPSLLKGKTLEDLVARWNSELDERVEDFKHTANEIAAWDQVLIQNGDQILMLYDELQRIEPIQSSIDQTLDYVETQQQELSMALEEYERQLSNQVPDFGATAGRTRTAAQEREEAYKTAEEVHVQLNDMASSLGTMIAELNTLAGPGNRIDESTGLIDGTISSSSNEDPIVQIAGILNAHLGSLNWISEITQELGSKVNELESRISNTKVEFGLESNIANHHIRQVEFNSDDFNLNHHLSSSSFGAGATHNNSFGNRVPSGLLSHPRR